MNVLWITNMPFPEASELIGQKSLLSGGWMVGAAKSIEDCSQIKLFVAFPLRKKFVDVKKMLGDKITYFSFPQMNYLKSIISKGAGYKKYLRKILNEANPDIVIIWGTEYSHSYAMAEICKEKKIPCAISIQGLMSIIAIHYMANVPTMTKIAFSFKELVPPWNLFLQRILFKLSGKNEQIALKNVKYILGRTEWDYACSSFINPSAKYLFNNEILRKSFYVSRKWEISKCERYSIFITQGGYPVKGLHYMLEALSLILKYYPSSKLYISGVNLCNIKWYKRSTYQKYLCKLIRKYKLNNNICFLGGLSEEQICDRFLRTHVYVSSSSIENESNSLSEAKILGVPCVVSYVGGVTSRIKHAVDGFTYQHDAPYMLAHFVLKIFESDAIAKKLSENSVKIASKINSISLNQKQILDNYNIIINDK